MTDAIAEAIGQMVTLAEAARASPLTYEALKKAAQRGRLAARKVGTGPRAYYITTLDAVARYVAESEAWRRNGRQPRIPRRAAVDRLTALEIEEVLP